MNLSIINYSLLTIGNKIYLIYYNMTNDVDTKHMKHHNKKKNKNCVIHYKIETFIRLLRN